MTTGGPHPLRAFLLAPLIVPVRWAEVLGVHWTQGPLWALGEVGVVVFSSLRFIYGAALLVAFPLYWLIRHRWSLALWHPVVVGTILGAAVLPFVEPIVEHTVPWGAVLGFAAGILFWVLWRPRPNGQLQRPIALAPSARAGIRR